MVSTSILNKLSNIRRYFKPYDTAFLTHVTYNRIPILIEHFDLLWESVNNYKKQIDYDLIAWVVMPDHFHMLLSINNYSISELIKKIKLSFSSNYRKSMGMRKGRVWQYRFWDHIIRDQNDLNKHVDYIHYNPIKHGLVNNPQSWKFSSFKEYLKEETYQPGWGEKPVKFEGDFGE